MRAQNLQHILDAVRATMERRKVITAIQSLADSSDSELAQLEQELEVQVELAKARARLWGLEEEAQDRWSDPGNEDPTMLSSDELTSQIQQARDQIRNLVESPTRLLELLSASKAQRS